MNWLFHFNFIIILCSMKNGGLMHGDFNSFLEESLCQFGWRNFLYAWSSYLQQLSFQAAVMLNIDHRIILNAPNFSWIQLFVEFFQGDCFFLILVLWFDALFKNKRYIKNPSPVVFSPRQILRQMIGAHSYQTPCFRAFPQHQVSLFNLQ